MAMKRCPDCGEKYSDSYKYCPFCEEEEILKEGKGRGVRRAKQSRSFSLLTPVLIVLILVELTRSRVARIPTGRTAPIPAPCRMSRTPTRLPRPQRLTQAPTPAQPAARRPL